MRGFKSGRLHPLEESNAVVRVWMTRNSQNNPAKGKTGAWPAFYIDGKPLSHLRRKLVLECFRTPSSGANGFFL
jgi:hypothetical protein